MKKLLVAFLCVCLSLCFTGCSILFTYQAQAIDGFDVGYSKVLNKAFVSAYNVEEAKRDITVVIPDAYDGAPITALGGYTGRGVPCAFGIHPSEGYFNALRSEVTQWTPSTVYADINHAETVFVNVTIHIGKNIEEIREHTLDCFYEGTYVNGQNGDSKCAVVFLYTFTCDDTNETFYVKDGKLYYQQNDALVPDILYADYDFSGAADSAVMM